MIAADAKRAHLRRARRFYPENTAPSVSRSGAPRQCAVVAQNHDFISAHVSDKPLAFVEGMIDMKRDAKGNLKPMVNVDGGEVMPDGTPGAKLPITAEQRKIIETAAAASGMTVEALEADFHKQRAAAATNGVGGH